MKILILSGIFAFLLVWAAFSPAGAPSSPSPGEQLFRSLNCVMCHGLNHQGTALAPPLKEIKKYWKRPALIQYLMDPVKVTKNDRRLKKQKDEYPQQTMPSYSSLRPEQMNQLVDWLMSLK